VDFYTGLLGQRLVKKTVNFDDPGTYHLYYGNETGAPGTILTFFPFADAGPGRAGAGMAAAYAYAVPKGGFDGWMERLARTPSISSGRRSGFGQRVILLRDPDGAPVELIETDRESDEALDGFHSVTLWERDLAPTARLMTDVFGYEEAGHETVDGVERLRLQPPVTRGARSST
jgi:glyoxalase family protein